MTRSIYVLGGAGSGKSTFMAELLANLPPMDPQTDLWTERNARGNPVTLRGHFLLDGGLYIGKMREEFPGTDGLDRASSMTGEVWLRRDQLPPYILAEGATLSTSRFLNALHDTTDLLLVHLWCEDFIRDLRFSGRGSNQNDGFVKNTATRARNLLDALDSAGASVLNVDSADPVAWKVAMAGCLSHLRGTE